MMKVIAIASGKGGVGKSTIAVNMAFSLKKAGHAVGLLDADLYGPSLPLLLNVARDTVVTHDDKGKMQPIVAYDLPTMSIGYLINEKAPAIWRGPIASKAIQQLFLNTEWEDLDYLVIDLPPGTGDIHLTLAQKLPLQGVIIVTTPQSIALADVRKAINMFQKVEIPCLGIIENMSAYQCHYCGENVHLFGKGGGEALAGEYQIPLLGCLPIDIHLQQQTEYGYPIVLSHPDSAVSGIYRTIATQVVDAKLRTRTKPFPTIVVE